MPWRSEHPPPTGHVNLPCALFVIDMEILRRQIGVKLWSNNKHDKFQSACDLVDDCIC